MTKPINEELLHLDDERIDWTEEYRERERLRREAEEKLAESRKEKNDETLEKICPPVYTSDECDPLGSKTLREDDIELYKRIREEVERDFAPKEYKTDYRSVTKVDFHSNEIPDRPRPEPRMCELAHEQPVTFWTEHFNCMPGITYTTNSSRRPFGRNAAFTTPIDQYLKSAMPGESHSYQR
ncbi:hypothetical protein CRM22_000449 [Opisthorchis felineus]|uniref:Uncharacterized protein n=1 Tax=Opisthorchis felineus TaxID=147828 RepID=A0A4V3SH91_OPIFE|nr:hypothetical protein CRM22_000449 [Opisthorchis felineus]